MIKLFLLEETETTKRLQSQLYLGRDVADFILEGNVLKQWTGLNFFKIEIPYEIVTDIKEMKYQIL